jgi:hypothetical protein
VLVFSLLLIVQAFFWGGEVIPGGYAGLFQVWLEEYHVTLGTHLVGLPNVSQAGLELASGGYDSSPVFSVKRGMEKTSTG